MDERTTLSQSPACRIAVERGGGGGWQRPTGHRRRLHQWPVKGNVGREEHRCPGWIPNQVCQQPWPRIGGSREGG